MVHRKEAIVKEVGDYAKTLGDMLLQSNKTIALAESCTGGAIAAAFTALPGASQWFHYGWIPYTNDAKSKLLGVDRRILETNGAVSEAAVQAMAAGALSISGAHYSIAVSGICGPGGGTETTPVGTVWIAFASQQSVEAKQYFFGGDRESIRYQAVRESLRGMLDKVG